MLNIAILDDDKTALMISKGSIEQFIQNRNIQCSIDTFSDAYLFIQAVKINNYTVVILDIDLQESNGIEVGKQVKEINVE